MSCSSCSTINRTRLGGQVPLSRSVINPPSLRTFNLADPAVYYAHLAGNRARVLDETLDIDDGGISTVSGGTASSQAVVPLKQMHQKFTGGQHSMWFM
jgi:hypothetical protein